MRTEQAGSKAPRPSAGGGGALPPPSRVPLDPRPSKALVTWPTQRI